MPGLADSTLLVYAGQGGVAYPGPVLRPDVSHDKKVQAVTPHDLLDSFKLWCS
jgi:hypothetical protein